MHPSFSGLLVTWAYFPQMTLPPCVTRPNSLTFTSMTVPLVITPKVVYSGDEGFFFTPRTGRQKVAFSPGCVTWAFLKYNPIGLMNLSYLGSFRVRSLVGCSPWGREESDMTERLHFRFSLSCIGEGNGNPLQCSCLENPRDGEAWWAAVYGVAQSRTRLKRLGSGSSSRVKPSPTKQCL